MPDRSHRGGPWSYDEALEFLLAQVVPRPDPKLRQDAGTTPVSRLLQALDNPHTRFPTIHIAGSKGKGTTAHFCAELLRSAGLKTGLFTSPHLVEWTERIRIDGKPIAKIDFARTTQRIAQCLEPLGSSPDSVDDNLARPSFFDFLTAAAFCWFAHQRVDVAVIETGLGGRFDATNVVQANVCVITHLELEHTDKLGSDIESIAWHKAGIIKSAMPVVAARSSEAAQQQIEAEASMYQAPIHWIEANSRRLQFDLAPLHLEPAWLRQNQCLALEAVKQSGLIESDQMAQLAKQLGTIKTPAGRAQVLAGSPPVLVDAAHSQDSIAALDDFIKDYLRDVGAAQSDYVLLISRSRLELPKALLALVARARATIVFRAEPFRSVSAEELLSHLRHELGDTGASYALKTSSTFADAILQAKAFSPSLIGITGSTYAAGAALAAYGPHASSDTHPV